MRKAGSLVLLMLLGLVLAGCGGGDGTIVDPADPGEGDGPGGETPPAQVAAVDIDGGSDTLPGDGSNPVTLTVQVRDASNVAVPNVEVDFAADSGTVTVVTGTTGSDGRAVATLATTDPTPRTITATATVTNSDGSVVSGTFQVAVVSTTQQQIGSIALSSSTTTLLADDSNSVEIFAVVRDTTNVVIPNVPVTFSADSGSLQVVQSLTGSDGRAIAQLTTPGEPELRTILVTASATNAQNQTFTGTISIQVVDVDEDVMDPPPVLSQITLVSSSNVLQSDGAQPVDLVARVLNENNVVLPDIPVTFSATSGELTVSQGITGADGRALAALTTQDNPANRTITITASAVNRDGSLVTDSVDVAVTGTELEVNGPTALVQGNTGSYSATLTDASGAGILGETLAVTSALGNSISATSLVTDPQGRIQFQLTATTGGNDIVTVAGFGEEARLEVAISDDAFRFVAPVDSDNPPAERPTIPLDTNAAVTVEWNSNGAPVTGETVVFSTTRGMITTEQVTDGSGRASNTISASDAGPAVITASGTGADAPSASIEVLFVAETADAIEVQASPFNVGPGEQSTIRAVVRDSEGNRVFGQRVIFTLDDVSGGGLTEGLAVTNAQGEARTVYQAGSVTSGSESVTVTATVDGTAPPVTDSVALTVARRELFIAFGTGNTVEEPNPTDYRLPLIVFASDADGNPVPDVSINMSVLTFQFQKGYWAGDQVANQWFRVVNVTCPDEDLDRDGVLDPGEDTDGDGVIDVGNEALIAPGTAVTGADGTAQIGITYAQEAGGWLQVIVEARTSVQGTEFTETAEFILPVLADDVSDLEVSPPGNLVPEDVANGYPRADLPGFVTGPVSPFGYSLSCANPL